jgi:hypothetical protein
MFGNGLEFFASQHLHFAATLKIRAAHLQPRNLQLHMEIGVGFLKFQIVQRAVLLLQSIDAALTENMATVKTCKEKK